LKILDDRQFCQLPVIRIANINRHVGPSCLDRRAQTTLARYELIPLAGAPDHDRLEKPVLIETVGQLVDFGVVKVAPGLVWVIVDLVHADPQRLAGRLTIRLMESQARAFPVVDRPTKQGFQSATKTTGSCRHRAIPCLSVLSDVDIQSTDGDSNAE
jgi:hypothetical protein